MILLELLFTPTMTWEDPCLERHHGELTLKYGFPRQYWCHVAGVHQVFRSGFSASHRQFTPKSKLRRPRPMQHDITCRKPCDSGTPKTHQIQTGPAATVQFPRLVPSSLTVRSRRPSGADSVLFVLRRVR